LDILNDKSHTTIRYWDWNELKMDLFFIKIFFEVLRQLTFKLVEAFYTYAFIRPQPDFYVFPDVLQLLIVQINF
jgi:hypothetical protein